MKAICSSKKLTVVHQTQAKVPQAYNGYWHCSDDQHHIDTHYGRGHHNVSGQLIDNTEQLTHLQKNVRNIFVP